MADKEAQVDWDDDDFLDIDEYYEKVRQLRAEVKRLGEEVEQLRACDVMIALLVRQMIETCEQVGLGKDHPLHDYVPLLGDKIAILIREVSRLRHELHDEQVRRDEWEKMYNQAIAGTEVERLRERLEHWKHISLKVAQMERSKQLAEVERLLKTALDNEVDSRVSVELEVEHLQAELALARVQLNRVRQDAQDQSDEIQSLRLSPCETERLRRQLARAQIQAAAPKKATEWLWGFYDGNTLVAKPGYEDDIREAWNELLIAIDSITGDALLDRLTKAEALAALVTPELAGLLDQLAGNTQTHYDSFVNPDATWVRQSHEDVAIARALAARIREALGENSD